jgi:hypothetical protein
MDTAKPTIALSTGDHKQAALFFDFVWPFHSMDSVPIELHDMAIEVPSFPAEEGSPHRDLFSRLLMNISKSSPERFTFSGR